MKTENGRVALVWSVVVLVVVVTAYVLAHVVFVWRDVFGV